MNIKEIRPVDLKKLEIRDAFWKQEMELVRKEVLPYQWNVLNDRVEGAAPSYCMHNFRAAAALNSILAEKPSEAPVFTYHGFEELPEGEVKPLSHYGFVFQDTDLYKWVEAAAYSLIACPDPALEKTADMAIDLVEQAQAPDGYLDTYYILNGRDAEFTNLRDNHELYCFGHLGEAAAAYYEATGKKKLLEIAEKFAAYIASKIGPEPGKKHGYPGHEIAEMALVRMYRATGKETYLKLAEYFIDERGKSPCYFDQEHPNEVHDYQSKEDPYSYFQAHRPVRGQDEAFGHAVRAVYLYSGMADIAGITGDEALKEACRKLWKSVTREKMYITGGIGSTHIGEAFSYPFDLPNDTAYAESCASIGLVFFARRMLETEPKSEYADVMERALYNGILSGMALDGKSFFYVNPLEVLPEACRKDARKAHVKPVRQKWFGCACCPPNIARLLSSVGAYALTEGGSTLFVHLYMSCIYRKTVSGREIIAEEIRTENEKEWKVSFNIRNAEDTDFVLAVRKPGWCRKPFICAEGAEISEKDGYYYIRKNWQSEDYVTLTLPLEIRVLQADHRVREDAGKLAVMYGPMVYALESTDNCADLHMLRIDPQTAVQKGKAVRAEICGRKALVLRIPGSRIRTEGEKGLYFDAAEEKTEEVMLHYIPYYMWANRGETEMQVWTLRR